MLQRKIVYIAVLLAIFTFVGQSVVAVESFARFFSASLSSRSAIADGKSSITFRVQVTRSDGNGGAFAESSVPVSAVTSGSADITPVNGTTDAHGNIVFTITSKSVGTNAIKIISSTNGGPESTVLTKNVDFVASNASPAQNPPPSSGSMPRPLGSDTSRQQAKQSSSNKKKQKTATGPLTLNEVRLGGKKISPSKDHVIPKIEAAKFIELQGKTTPKTNMTIYIYSKPKKYTAESDMEGNWSVLVGSLPAGKHRAELELVDPATKKTLPRVELGSFEIVPTKVNRQVVNIEHSDNKKITQYIPVVAGIIGTITGLVVVVVFIRKYRHKIFKKYKSKNDSLHL